MRYIYEMEQEEFEHIAKQIRQLAINVSRGIGVTTEEAEDIAQEVMLKLWAMRADIKPNLSIESFTVTVTRHLTIDHLRKKKYQMVDAEQSILDERQPSPHEQLEINENEHWLEDRLKQLPSRQYTILRMQQVERKSNQEIARLLDIEPATVATLLSRARAELLKDIKRRFNI